MRRRSISPESSPDAQENAKRPRLDLPSNLTHQDCRPDAPFARALQRKSLSENLQALQVLCQRSILANLRQFYTLKEAPFAVLPWNLIGDLVTYVADRAPHVLTNPDLLPLFVTEQTSVMSADFQQCRGNTEAVQRLMVFKLASQSPNLTKLDLSMKDYSRTSTTLVSQADPMVMHRLVNSLLSRLSHLEELHLNCYLEYSSLKLIGQTCLRLKHLDISGNRGVTNLSMFRLCPGSDPEAGRCALIEVLDVTNTGVGITGGVHALASLPRLKIFRHNSTYSVLKAFRERHRNRVLPALKVLQISEMPFRARFSTSEHLKQVCELVPEVTTLSLSRVPDISPLLSLRSVTSLELMQFNSEYAAQEVELMLATFSLSRLSISGSAKLDLSMVAFHCLQMEHLDAKCPLQLDSMFETNRSQFQKLQTLDLCPSELQELPPAIVDAALSSPLLRRLSFSNIILPSKQIHELMDEAEAKEIIFSQLQSIKLEHIGVESFLDKENLLLRFVAVVPTLQQVYMNNNKYPCTTEREIQLLRLFAKIHRGETLRLRSTNKKLNFIS